MKHITTNHSLKDNAENWFSIILDDIFIIYVICDDILGYSFGFSLPLKLGYTHTHTHALEHYSAIKKWNTAILAT